MNLLHTPWIISMPSITGSTYLKYTKIHFGILGPFPAFASLRYFLNPQPYFVTQKRRKISEPIGRIRLLTRKSSKSSTLELSPKGWNHFHILNPNTHGSESNITRIILMAAAFVRDILNFSMQQHMIFSNTAIIVESDAKVMNKKNRVPHILPPDIEANTFGSV